MIRRVGGYHPAMTGLARRSACLITAATCLTIAPAIPASAATAPRTVRLVAFNIYKSLDHAKWQTDWNRIAKQADIAFLEETPNVRVRTLVNKRTWTVRQATGQYRSEVTLVFRRSVARKVSNVHVVRMLTHRSCRSDLVVGSRYLATAHVVLTNARALTVAVTHLPPGSCTNDTYERMAAHVRTWATAHQRRLVLGADWNQQLKNDPGGISKATDLRAHGVGIDGFQINKRITVTRTRLLGSDSDYFSDHVPVQVTIRR